MPIKTFRDIATSLKSSSFRRAAYDGRTRILRASRPGAAEVGPFLALSRHAGLGHAPRRSADHRATRPGCGASVEPTRL